MATDSNVYVVEPDIPVGLTIGEYRRLRVRRRRWWRRVLGTRTGAA